MADFEPRGRIDLRRDSNLYNQRILRQRIEATRFPGNIAREDTEPELVRRQIHQKLPDMQRLAKVAVIATGAALVGRAMGTNRIIKALSHMGSTGYNVRDRIFRPARHMIDDAILGPFPEARQLSRDWMGASAKTTIRVDPDLSHELQQIYSKYKAIGTGSMQWLHGPNSTGIDLHRKWLSERYAGKRTGRGLQGLQVADILDNKGIRGSFSSKVIENLRKGQRMGLITRETHVSRRGVAGLFKDRGGKVLDSQWANPLRMFDAVFDTARQINVLGVRPAELIMGGIRPLISSGEHLTIGSNIRLPNGIRTTEGLSFNLGGRVFSQLQGKAQFAEVARGVKVYDISKEGSHFFARALAAADGRLSDEFSAGLKNRMANRKVNPTKHFWQRVQDVAGVGPEFQTHRSLPTEIYDFFARRRYGDFHPNSHMPRDAQMGFYEKIQNRVVAETRARTAGLNPREYSDAFMKEAVTSRVKNVGDLSFTERVKAYANNSKAGTFWLKKPTKSHPGVSIGLAKNPRRPMQGFTPLPAGHPAPVGPGGNPTKYVPATGVVDLPGGVRTFNTVMHHMTERLNHLLGMTTGMGFRPTGGRLGWVGNLAKLYGIYGAGRMGAEYAKYGDYLAGEALDFIPGLDNTTPSEYAVKAYSEMQVLRQRGREALGIQQSAEYLEGLAPGSVSLPGSFLARTVAPIAYGAYRAGRVGALTGGLVSLAVGGTDLDMSANKLDRIYKGQDKVPIMQARGWVLGQQPWGGDKISGYQHHCVHRYLSNYRFTDVQYGSKGEYFSYESGAPTPHNFFGLKKLLGADHYAQKHYFNRPYPYGATGERMHAGEDFISQPSMEAFQAMAMGMEPNTGTYNLGINPGTYNAQLRRGFNYLTEMGGIYKFLAEQVPFYDDMFGEERGHDMYAADASTITSGSREWYDENLGGLLGMSELLRRFLDPDQGRQGINYIPNQMPTWLPGARSEFIGDQDYYDDFTLGDPYARIQQGEARLPGKGYESLARLHSKTPGVYDAMDRYLILADVAPYSEAFRNYRTIVQAWISGGALDKSWTDKYLQVEDQVKERLDGPEYTPRIFSGVRSGTTEELARVNEYNAAERFVGASWEHLTHDLVPSVGRVVPLVGTVFDRKIMGQRSAFESYLEDHVYGTDFHDWKKPWDSFIEPRLTNLVASDPLTAMTGGAALSMFFGATPVGLIAGGVGAAALGMSSALRAVGTGRLRGGFQSSEFKEASQQEAYFDALQYTKMNKLSKLASEQGNTQLADAFSRKAERTSIGMPYDADGASFLQAARFRLGNPMKNYAWQMLQAPPETRQRIMEVAPQVGRSILASAWAREGDQRFDFRPRGSPASRAQDAIAMYGMPGNDWAGWHPDVPLDSIKIRTLDSVHNMAYDMHKHDLWKSDRRRANRDFPTLRPAF